MIVARPRNPRRILAAAVVVLGLLGLFSCGRAPSPPRDAVGPGLTEALGPPEIHREVSVLDPGNEVHWGRGWEPPEGGGTMRWASAREAEVRFWLAEARDLEIFVAGRAFAAPGAERQSTTASLGGRELQATAAREGEPGWTFSAPATALRRGWNVLVLSFEHLYRPRDWIEGSEDRRTLAFQARGVEIRGGREAGAPAVGPRELVLPVGSGVEWFLRERKAEMLRFEGLSGDATCVVEVEGPDGILVDGAPLEPGGVLAASLSGMPIYRVALFAVPSEGWLRFGPGEPVTVRATLDPTGPRIVPPTPTTEAETSPPAPERPDLLVYLVDTLRADALAPYGGPPELSPRLVRFAEDAVTFTRARAQTSWTRSAVVSLMTGLLPAAHGVRGREDVLVEDARTLAEILSDAGYRTVGVTTNGNVGPRFGVGQGFDVYQHLRESRERPEVHVLADEVNRWVETWLDALPPREEREPFFLYVHVTDPHAPYMPVEPFRSRFAAGVDPELGGLDAVHAITGGRRAAGPEEAERMRRLYDAEVAFVDEQFGQLVDGLDRRGLYDPSAIVFLSDHGEEFLEHGGWGHGRTLYEEQLRVPIVLKLPGGRAAGRRVEAPAAQIDLFPTLLALAGEEPPEPVQGRDLLPSIGAEAAGSQGVAAEARGVGEVRLEAPGQAASLQLGGRDQESLVRGDDKLISTRGGAELELYDLGEDPGERADRIAERPLVAGWLRQELRRLAAETAGGLATRSIELDPATREQLEALGYVQ